MMEFSPIDPRSICNFMLDQAGTEKPITHIALQKLLYFAHGMFLCGTGRPLVSGYFEAWKHGPVHPGVYIAFKAAGSKPIDFRVKRRDPLTGEAHPINPPTDFEVINCVKRVISNYGSMSAAQLRTISHAPRGPWAWVVKDQDARVAYGLRIPDLVIAERFIYHKVSVNSAPDIGEPSEDEPFNS